MEGEDSGIRHGVGFVSNQRFIGGSDTCIPISIHRQPYFPWNPISIHRFSILVNPLRVLLCLGL